MIPVIIGLFQEFWYGLISRIVGFFLKPLFDFLVDQNILSQNYITDSGNFIFNNIMPKFKFARDVIINVTGIPVQVFVILGSILSLSFALYVTFLAFKFVLNAWAIFRSGNSVIRVGRRH